MENKTVYPIYRKLSNNRSYYHLISDRKFEEIQMIGSIKKRYIHEAKQYPEILFIQDLIKIAHEGILKSNKMEWCEISKS